MKKLKKLVILIPFFVLSCASTQYVETYEPINLFLETQKIEKNKKYILLADKAKNKQMLRIFNGEEGAEHIVDSRNPTDYTDGLFVEKHWKKMYMKYAEDTIKKYWKKEDFPQYDFVLENEEGLFKGDFYNRYLGSSVNQVIIISEPMYYMDKKYIMFYVNIGYFDNSVSPRVVIMKKEKGKWVVVKTIGDYIYY